MSRLFHAQKFVDVPIRGKLPAMRGGDARLLQDVLANPWHQATGAACQRHGLPRQWARISLLMPIAK